MHSKSTKSIDWFLYDRDLCHERVNYFCKKASPEMFDFGFKCASEPCQKEMMSEIYGHEYLALFHSYENYYL